MDEARIVRDRTVVVALSDLDDPTPLQQVCGTVVRPPHLGSLAGKTVFLCGDLTLASALDLRDAERVFVVSELSRGGEDLPWPAVGLGRVPVLVHGVGVYWRRLFDPSVDVFARVSAEHTFQRLTESTKPSAAHRQGIYLTPVERDAAGLHFHLLRCSTNLSGPTENFRATDWHLVGALNHEAGFVLGDHAPLNHVLAQIYPNTPATDEARQTKAKIRPHADKTKDMPRDGVMAFCTFYDRLDGLAPLPKDPFDLGVRGVSALTRLAFRLKRDPGSPPPEGLPEQFTVTLYPHSAFLVPLSTNRWYTHEIQASPLDASVLPTRLGYVVRCSKTEAVHADGQTSLNGAPLAPPTPEGMAALRAVYAEENRATGFIDYGDRFGFSMNTGDYAAPAWSAEDEFRRYPLSSPGDPFAELSASARVEEVGTGRYGAVLVAPGPRGVPLVRTTTPYAAPAQRFGPAHAALERRIREVASLRRPLNNALFERYTDAYTKMGAHSDQAQDLEEDTFIALYSCYRDALHGPPPRSLVVESKEPGGGSFSIPLDHDGVVVFSLATNRRYKHKIVLTRPNTGNEWIGVTFRTSATFLTYDDDDAFFEDGTPLTLADEAQRGEILKLRGRENREVDVGYPPRPYTLSPSDRWRPT